MWALFTYIFIVILCIFAKLFLPEDIWDWFGVADTSSAIALAILAGWGYYEYVKSEDEIKIIFDVAGKKIDTGLSILRKECTRSELMGVLGMIQKNQKEKYKLAYMKDKNILKQLHKIQKGKDKEFILKISEDELKQFDISVDD